MKASENFSRSTSFPGSCGKLRNLLCWIYNSFAKPAHFNSSSECTFKTINKRLERYWRKSNINKQKETRMYQASEKNRNEQTKVETFYFFVMKFSCFKKWLTTAIFLPSPDKSYRYWWKLMLIPRPDFFHCVQKKLFICPSVSV